MAAASAPPALATLPFRWRTAADEPQAKWRFGNTGWLAGQTVDDVRRALASSCKSDADLAAGHPPELWYCDEDGGLRQPDRPVPPAALLKWTNVSYRDRRLGDENDDGSPKAVVVFTFPPAAAVTRTHMPRRPGDQVSWHASAC